MKQTANAENTRMKGLSRLRNYLLALALIAVVLAGIVFLYTSVASRVIDASIQSMEELTLHDEASIAKSIEYRWQTLDGLGRECRQAKCQTIQELLALLHLKESSLNCIDLALVDEAGDIYFGSLFITRDEQISQICAGSERFVERYDGLNQGTRRAALLFGVTITPFTVEGRTFTHIICRFHLDTLGGELKIDSYDGDGYSSVFDSNGYYIINIDRSHSMQDRDNFYEDLKEYRLLDGSTVEGIRERLSQRETFTITLEQDGRKELMRFAPVDGMDWYFIMAVSHSVFEKQSVSILLMVLAVFVVMFCAVAAAIIMLLRSRTAVNKARAEQLHREELSTALALAEQASRAKTTFLNNMSHDIRTPMNAIIGFTRLASTHIDDAAKVKDYLAKITQSSNHLLSLINDVLDMSRIESGKVVIEERPENLAEMLHGIRDIIQTDIHSKQLELFIDSINVTDEEILCDRLRVNQILLNLLSNAMKFTPPGGAVSLRLIQKECARPGCGAFEVRVKDTGIGMSPEFAQTIFEPFTREHTSTVSGIQGTGLGMSITKNIVDMMGGQIEVISEKGKGTEFVVSLEFKLQETHKEIEPVLGLEGVRALVVDDDMDSCQSVSRMLREIGMRSEWTMHGKEAVARAEEALQIGDQYGVYVIDWLMPDINGVETARRIRRAVGSDVPIILLSAYDWTDIEDEAREAGITDFIGKPLFHSELHRILARLCGGEREDSPEPDDSLLDFSGRRILLVEDNELNREIATEILQDAGFVIETAVNGREAVHAVQSSKPGYYDLVLMDVQMPVMDGHEATRAIRALADPALANILIVAMTANAFEEDKKAAADAGMNAHVGKPIDVPVLMDTLRKILL